MCTCTFLRYEALCRYCVHRDEQCKHRRMNLITNEIAALKTALDEALELFQEN